MTKELAKALERRALASVIIDDTEFLGDEETVEVVVVPPQVIPSFAPPSSPPSSPFSDDLAVDPVCDEFFQSAEPIDFGMREVTLRNMIRETFARNADVNDCTIHSLAENINVPAPVVEKVLFKMLAEFLKVN